MDRAAPPTVYDAVTYAAKFGWPVFPLKVGTKKPACRHGFKQATLDEDQIIDWWSEAPYNIGIATGVAFDVVDIDGEEALDVIDAFDPDGEVLIGPMVHTRPGRLQVYIKPTGHGCRTGMLGTTLDYRGTGGYCVAPPSIHPDTGQPYTWCEARNMHEPLRTAPEWLLRMLDPPKPRPALGWGGLQRLRSAHRGPRYGQTALEAEVGRVACAPVGQRNKTLVAGAYRMGQLVAIDVLERGDVEAALLLVALRAGLEHAESVATIESGLDAGYQNPRNR